MNISSKKSLVISTEYFTVCTRCVMDESVPGIAFDEGGICNYCSEFFEKYKKIQSLDDKKKRATLDRILEKVKVNGKGKEYDCVIGVSGGLDSSYTLYMAKRLGLRPLAVHLDNGWNSELAVSNIEKLINKLGVDLYTHVINWEEFRDLQRAFLKANVIDIEMLTDHALQTLLYRTVRDMGLKHIVTGTNIASEGMRLPPGWIHLKLDAKNIISIYRTFGSGKKFETFPLMGVTEYVMHSLVRGISWISFPDYISYIRDDAIKTLKSETGWRPYEKKHYESVFTRFYQGYILPRKFKVDKRKMHFSNLICSGQMSRETALEYLKRDTYENPLLLHEDKEFFLKKLGFSNDEFEDYLTTPAVAHTTYHSHAWILSRLMLAARLFRG